jgi:hypothetical protein
VDDELTSGVVEPDGERVPGGDDEDDDEPVEDEYDPFADRKVDPPPKEGEEGDDRVHKDNDG